MSVDPHLGAHFLAACVCQVSQSHKATCLLRIGHCRITIVEVMGQLGKDNWKGKEFSRRRICWPLEERGCQMQVVSSGQREWRLAGAL